MSIKTENYKLIKPELSDPALITATNENWDKIDAELHKAQTEIIPPSRGGTGVSNLADAWVGHSYHLTPMDCSNTDFNTLKESARYFGYTGMVNGAFENEICILEVIPYSKDWVLQRQTRLTDGQMYFRYHNGVNGWSNWEIFYTSKYNNSSASIEVGTYVGTGYSLYNSDRYKVNDITLNFKNSPKIVFIIGETNQANDGSNAFIIPNYKYIGFAMKYGSYTTIAGGYHSSLVGTELTLSSNSVGDTSLAEQDAKLMQNTSGKTYTYIAMY